VTSICSGTLWRCDVPIDRRVAIVVFLRSRPHPGPGSVKMDSVDQRMMRWHFPGADIGTRKPLLNVRWREEPQKGGQQD
jgi:hypothetical protein